MKKLKNIILSIIASMALIVTGGYSAFAEEEDIIGQAFSVSPMNQKIILVPGERYDGVVNVTNPSYSIEDVHYYVSVAPYAAVGEEYDADFESITDSNAIVDWISFDSEDGYIKPNDTKSIIFHVDVPKDAPAGGQYAAIMIENNPDTEEPTEGFTINSTVQIASILYATVMGDTEESGDITTNSFPGFALQPPVSGSVTMKNTGNVHLTATTTLQIFPLFSDEEIYTNEEEPTENLIMPGTTRSTITKWEGAPNIGIFHIIQTVKLSGKTSVTDKYLFICPIWLLIVVAFVIVLIIVWLIINRKYKY